MFKIRYTKDGGKAVAMAMLTEYASTLRVRWQSTLSHGLQEDRVYDCGCTSGSALRNAAGSLRKRTHPP